MSSTSVDVLNRYFFLSDTAGQNSNDFDELVNLFAPDASIISGRAEQINGADAVQDFFRAFFSRNVELHHVWTAHTVNTGDAADSADYSTVVVDWAVAGRSKSGAVVALSGVDTATVNAENKIVTLRVVINNGAESKSN